MFDRDTFHTHRFTRGIILRKVRLLIHCVGFSGRDAEDLEQELLMRLYRGLSRYDPSRCRHVNVFITTVIERSVGMILREQSAKKRAPTGIRSLDAPPIEGEPRAEVPDQASGPNTDRIDLAHDLRAVLETLPAPLRDLAERLMVQTVSKTARDCQVPRTTLMRQVERLRRYFEDAGLQIYV